MNNAVPTTDEQELALRVAMRIDGAEYRPKSNVASRKIRVQHLQNLVLDEMMQFNRQVVEPAQKDKDSRQAEMEW